MGYRAAKKYNFKQKSFLRLGWAVQLIVIGTTTREREQNQQYHRKSASSHENRQNRFGPVLLVHGTPVSLI
jgi:hypothetical protein